MDISHKNCITILKQKDRYGKMKDSLRSENEKRTTEKTPIKIES